MMGRTHATQNHQGMSQNGPPADGVSPYHYLWASRCAAALAPLCGGGVTDAGGAPNADRIARWDGSAWHPLGGGVNGSVRDITIDGANVSIGGGVTDAGDNPNADGIARASLLKKAYLPLIVREAQVFPLVRTTAVPVRSAIEALRAAAPTI